MKKRDTLVSILLVVVLTLIACFVGYTISVNQLGGAFINWQPEQLPKMQQPDHFILGEGHVVYIKTTEGILFSRRLSCAPDISWHKVEGGIPEKSSSGNSFGYCMLNDAVMNNRLKIRNPPGEVVERLDCLYSMGADDLGCNFRFVILSNGEMWSWRYSLGLESIGNYCAIAGISLVVGSMFGILLLRFLKRKSY